jgi:indole-3-glycerol phosphate synthase
VDLPLLRKDFIVDEFQILEAAAAGADAILLIVAALEQNELERLRAFAEELGLDALVEVHDADELARGVDAGASVIGVNNRDLQTLDVSLETSRQLAAKKPVNSIFVSESGISTRIEIDELRDLGFDAFLVGEALVRSGDPKEMLEELGA